MRVAELKEILNGDSGDNEVIFLLIDRDTPDDDVRLNLAYSANDDGVRELAFVRRKKKNDSQRVS